MEVNLRPETEPRLQELAAKTGCAPTDLVEDAMAGYLQELAQTRDMLDSRYDELKGGRVKTLDGEKAFADLRRKKPRTPFMSEFVLHLEAYADLTDIWEYIAADISKC